MRAMLLVGVLGLFVFQSNSLTIRNFTLSVPDTNPAVTVSAPPASGVMATQEFVIGRVPTPIVPSIANGTITLTNGTGTAQVPSTVSRCVVSDPSGNSVRYTRLSTTLTVFGVGPTVDFICV